MPSLFIMSLVFAQSLLLASLPPCAFDLEDCKNEQFNLETNNELEKKNFINHVLQKHIKLKNCCPFIRCNRKVSSNDALKCHIGAFHVGKHNFQCPLCSGYFSCEYYYRTHLINKHTSTRNTTTNTLTKKQHHQLTVPQKKQSSFWFVTKKQTNPFPCTETVPPLIHITRIKKVATFLKQTFSSPFSPQTLTTVVSSLSIPTTSSTATPFIAYYCLSEPVLHEKSLQKKA